MATSGKRRTLTGMVVSDKMDKTIVVEVQRKLMHPIYKKFINKRKRYMAHDSENQCGIGDKVVILESRPLSRKKRWVLREVLEKAE
ncbi:MAG: 30S ribosomal protein S17 [Deltaproteobacteria bacterium]|uniref:Small ribosomal subunit protein uS17 n=1 Tax=Candidatus Zymogenus saltonus TaxID=2844893 RepID=A0A9D8KFW6_9DELT|nr:30S ribosomal protein S17 [Candidatus Zymogenus saltonus]